MSGILLFSAMDVMLWMCSVVRPGNGNGNGTRVSVLITNQNFQARGVDIHVVGDLVGGGVDSEQECVCWVEEGVSVRNWMNVF
jgi:hypothetical protein